MLQSELNKMNYIIDNHKFTPVYKVESYSPIIDESGNTVDLDLIGITILKSAEENYKDSLKESLIKPSEGEVLMSNVILENATLKQQMVEQQELTANLLLQIAELKGGNANV